MIWHAVGTRGWSGNVPLCGVTMVHRRPPVEGLSHDHAAVTCEDCRRWLVESSLLKLAPPDEFVRVHCASCNHEQAYRVPARQLSEVPPERCPKCGGPWPFPK